MSSAYDPNRKLAVRLAPIGRSARDAFYDENGTIPNAPASLQQEAHLDRAPDGGNGDGD